MTFSATGIIMPVVAVLLSHIDRNHDGNMKPISILQYNTHQASLQHVTSSSLLSGVASATGIPQIAVDTRL